MAQLPIQIVSPARLRESVRTLRRLGIPTSSSSTSLLSISPVSQSLRSPSSRPRRSSSASIPTLLVPQSTTPQKTLALLQKLSLSASGPFFAAGRAGAINAALFAAACLAPRYPKIRRALDLFRSRQTRSVPSHP